MSLPVLGVEVRLHIAREKGAAGRRAAEGGKSSAAGLRSEDTAHSEFSAALIKLAPCVLLFSVSFFLFVCVSPSVSCVRICFLSILRATLCTALPPARPSSLSVAPLVLRLRRSCSRPTC